MPLAKHNLITQSLSICDLEIANTTLVALVKSKEHGNLIDVNLLVQLILNPEEIPNLKNEYRMTTNAAAVDSLIAP